MKKNQFLFGAKVTVIKLVYFVLFPIGWVLSRHRLLIVAFVDLLGEIIKNNSRFNFCYILRRKRLRGGGCHRLDVDSTHQNVFVVMQGPIKQEDEFTLETLKLYSRTMPGVTFVLSTWREDESYLISRFDNMENVVVVLSDPPSSPGYGNSNYQIKSTAAGVQKAVQLGAKYVLKTRTDQRFESENVVEYLLSLLDVFKLSEAIEGQKERIVFLDINTFKYIPFILTDMMQFGRAEDIANYWNVEMQDAEVDSDLFARNKYTNFQWAQHGGAAGRVAKNFLGEAGIDISLKKFYKVLAERFIVVDKASIGFYWGKYDCRESFVQIYEELNLMETLSFKDWLVLYANVDKINSYPEEYLNRSFWN